MPSDYQPINCHYYDLLELVALRRSLVEVRYRDQRGNEKVQQVCIEDLWAKEGEEFMRMSDEVVIRLDQLISVDGQARPETGCAWP